MILVLSTIQPCSFLLPTPSPPLSYPLLPFLPFIPLLSTSLITSGQCCHGFPVHFRSDGVTVYHGNH